LIKKKGHKCELCGFTEWLDKPILLILDHINGNSDDYSLENLRVICSNCDSTLSTYKNRIRAIEKLLKKIWRVDAKIVKNNLITYQQ